MRDSLNSVTNSVTMRSQWLCVIQWRTHPVTSVLHSVICIVVRVQLLISHVTHWVIAHVIRYIVLNAWMSFTQGVSFTAARCIPTHWITHSVKESAHEVDSSTEWVIQRVSHVIQRMHYLWRIRISFAEWVIQCGDTCDVTCDSFTEWADSFNTCEWFRTSTRATNCHMWRHMWLIHWMRRLVQHMWMTQNVYSGHELSHVTLHLTWMSLLRAHGRTVLYVCVCVCVCVSTKPTNTRWHRTISRTWHSQKSTLPNRLCTRITHLSFENDAWNSQKPARYSIYYAKDLQSWVFEKYTRAHETKMAPRKILHVHHTIS